MVQHYQTSNFPTSQSELIFLKNLLSFFSCPETTFLLQNQQTKFVATLTQVRLNVVLVVLNLFTLLMVYLHARPEGTALRQQEEL